jgi:hypothetical protein
MRQPTQKHQKLGKLPLIMDQPASSSSVHTMSICCIFGKQVDNLVGTPALLRHWNAIATHLLTNAGFRRVGWHPMNKIMITLDLVMNQSPKSG